MTAALPAATWPLAALDLGEVPRVLAQRELYAIPALIGAAAYALAWSAGLTHPGVIWTCVVLISTFRLLALWRDWQAPAPKPPLLR